MAIMSIDCDAHVIETPKTWEYMPPEDLKYQPVVVKLAGSEQRLQGADEKQRQYWAFDGRLIPRERNIGDDTDRASREMDDIPARLKHMDELHVDVQVLFPSLWLRPITHDPKLELALARSYNRWTGDVCSRSNGRMKWVVIPPLLSLNNGSIVRDELVWAKANGAVGIHMCGYSCDKEMTDPYFEPFYEMAQELDLPICFHAGNQSFTIHDFHVNSDGYPKFKVPVISAFNSLLLHGIPKRYPGIRWGFAETGAMWVPYVLHETWRRYRMRGKSFDMETAVEENNFYVAAQANEDIGYLAKVAGENWIMMATDYGHADTSSEIDAMLKVEQRNELSQSLKEKVLRDNAKRFYKL